MQLLGYDPHIQNHWALSTIDIVSRSSIPTGFDPPRCAPSRGLFLLLHLSFHVSYPWLLSSSDSPWTWLSIEHTKYTTHMVNYTFQSLGRHILQSSGTETLKYLPTTLIIYLKKVQLRFCGWTSEFFSATLRLSKIEVALSSAALSVEVAPCISVEIHYMHIVMNDPIIVDTGRAPSTWRATTCA